MEEEFIDPQDEAKCNYAQVDVSELPLGKLASKYGLIPDNGFYFKKECTTFHIFLRLLGNVYFGSTKCRDYLTWKKEKFKFKPFLYRLINFVLLGFFVSYFFVSVTWIAVFFNLAVLTVGINALIWLYLAVVTVKAAIANKE